MFARAELLHAVALAVAQRDDLPGALRRIAGADPLLAAAAERVARQVEDGAGIGTALHRSRVIGRGVAGEVDGLTGDRLARRLDELALGRMSPTPGYAWVRWYPEILAGGLATVAVCSTFLGSLLFGDIMQGMGLRSRVLFGIPELAQWGLAMPLLIPLIAGVVCIAWRWVAPWRGLRHLQWLHCTEVHRAAALVRLIRAARAGDDQPQPIPRWWRPITALRITTVLPDRTRWDVDWRTWWMLTKWRLDRPLREGVKAMPDLAGRLRALGLVPAGSGPIDARGWDEAEARAREAYLRALQAARPWLWYPAVIAAVWIGMVAVGHPLLSIISWMGVGI